jgi:hypothetical protein
MLSLRTMFNTFLDLLLRQRGTNQPRFQLQPLIPLAQQQHVEQRLARAEEALALLQGLHLAAARAHAALQLLAQVQLAAQVQRAEAPRPGDVVLRGPEERTPAPPRTARRCKRRCCRLRSRSRRTTAGPSAKVRACRMCCCSSVWVLAAYKDKRSTVSTFRRC